MKTQELSIKTSDTIRLSLSLRFSHCKERAAECTDSSILTVDYWTAAANNAADALKEFVEKS